MKGIRKPNLKARKEMADVKILGLALQSWEGGFSNDPDDRGGATMRGVTLATYREYRRRKGRPAPTVEDLRRIPETEWWDLLKTMFWDPWQADRITCQAVANICVNWGWGSGVRSAIKAVQKALGLEADGVAGPVTLAALNKSTRSHTPEYTFNRIKAERGKQLLEAANSSNNTKYLNGWLRKWEGFRLHSLDLADGKTKIEF